MDENVLRTMGLVKTYKNMNALDGVNMTIKKGQIYGLIGRNGAGKTTLIRMITGLSSRTSGNIELFGECEDRKIEHVRSRVGAVVDAPGTYMNRTVYQNLEIDKIQKGIPGNHCIEKVLDMMGLMDVKDKKVKGLSLGTRQKLGIALALLGDPEFLVLDEPINGVDPIGMIEIRQLLRKLNQEKGVTILISSHILGELHQLANCYGIIHKGRLIEQMTAEELEDRCRKFVHIKVDDAAKAAVIMNSKLSTSNFEVLPDNVMKLYDYVDNTGKIAETLVKEGIELQEIMPQGDDLESYFYKVAGGAQGV